MSFESHVWKESMTVDWLEMASGEPHEVLGKVA